MYPDNQQTPIQTPRDDSKPNEYGPTAIVAGDVSQSAKKAEGRLDFIKKKPVWISLVAVLVLAAAGGVFALSRGDDKPVAGDTQSSLGVAVSLVDGEATYKTGDGDWQALTTQTELGQGDWVSTEVGGRAVLTFDDGSALRLDELSIVRLNSLNPDDMRIEQSAGKIYSRVVASERKYSVVVDETDYTALGTAFVTINDGTDKGVQVLQSSVKISDVEDSITEGKQYFKDHSKPDLEDKTTEISLDEVKSDSFMLWNLEQDEKDANFKDKLGFLQKLKDTQAPEPEQEETDGSGIKLTAQNSTKGTILSWTVSDVDVSNGFKVVRSKSTSTPTFGIDEAEFVSDPSARSYTWKSKTQGEYWYRVCAYRPDGSGCDDYSNAVKMQAVYFAPEKVTRGAISLNVDENNQLHWTFAGTAPYGFKVVVSTSENPSYPDDGYVYAGNGKSYQLKSTDLSDGINYVRVCKYTNGTETEKCVDYSTQLGVYKDVE